MKNQESTNDLVCVKDQPRLISCKDMLAYILRRWKIIFFVSLIFSVIAGGYQYICDVSLVNTESGQEDINSSNISELESLMSVLTDTEIEEVQDIYFQYLSYRALLDSDEEDSLLMWLDSDHLITYSIEYSFQSDRSGIVTSFVDQTLGAEEYAAIAELMSNSENIASIKKIFLISGSEENVSSSYSGILQDSYDSCSFTIKNSYEGFIYITFVALDNENGEKIQEIVRSAVFSHLEDLKSIGIDLSMVEVGVTLTDGIDSSLWDIMLSVEEERSEAFTNLKKFESNYLDVLEDDEFALYEYYLAYGWGPTELSSDIEREGVEADAVTTEAVSTTVSIDVKKFARGFFVGLIVMAILYMVIYLMSDSVKCLGEVLSVTKRPIFAVLRKDPQYRGINGFFIRLADQLSYGKHSYSQRTQVNLAAERIYDSATRGEKKHIFLITDVSTLPAKDLLKAVLDSSVLRGMEIRVGNPVEDDLAFHALRECDLAIIVTVLKCTDASSLSQNVCICREIGIEVGGNIVVGEI